ncbi:MAG: DUF445 family protein [Candidatus Sericytochromatia bacterium]|nr:DUF445 family protein [Candidatus Tanganyikabacteria bacterium]
MTEEQLTYLLIVVFAAGIAGRLVDFSAVWFLFHPYKEYNIPLLRKLGVLPRRQKELARQVARLIEERLITRQRIGEFISSDEMAGKVRATVRDALRSVVEADYPSVRDLLSRELGSAVDIDREIHVFADWVGERVADLVGRPAFRSRVANFMSEFLASRRDRALETLLPRGTFEAISGYLEGRWDKLSAEADEAAAQLDAWAASLGLVTDYVPQQALDVTRARIKERLPAWFKMLEDLLREEQTKAAVKTYLFDVLDRLAASNPNVFTVEGFLGAWRTLFPDDFARRVDVFIDETLPRLRRALEDPQNLEFIRQRVDLWFEELARTPLGHYYLRLKPDARAELRGAVAMALRSPNVRRTVHWLVGQVVGRARGARLGEVVPAEVFAYDPVLRRLGELDGLAPEVVGELILPQLELLLDPARLPEVVEAATAKDTARLATLLEAGLPGLQGDAYREVHLYRSRLLGEAPAPQVGGADWVQRAVDSVCANLAEEPAQDLIRAWTRRGVELLLGIPVGRPAAALREERIVLVEEIAVRQIVALLRDHSHRIAQAIDLKEMARKGVEAADPRNIEDVVKRQLARDEFNTIFLIGLLFGGVVGLVMTGIFHGAALLGGWVAVLALGVTLIAVMLRVVRV